MGNKPSAGKKKKRKKIMDTYYMKLSHITELSGVVSTFFDRYSMKTLESMKKEPQKVFRGLATRAIGL